VRPPPGTRREGEPGRGTRSVPRCTAPRAEPPVVGFTNSGTPSEPITKSMTAAAPRSWKVSRGSDTDKGVRSPAAAAVFAWRPVDDGKHRTRRIGPQPAQQAGVGVRHHHLNASLGQGIPQLGSGPERDVPLGRKAAGQDDDVVQLRHRGGARARTPVARPARFRSRQRPARRQFATSAGVRCLLNGHSIPSCRRGYHARIGAVPRAR
jgi:hypothetical protein